MFGKSGAFGLSTVAAGLVIRPALSWVDCRPSYLFSTGDVLDAVDLSVSLSVCLSVCLSMFLSF